MEHSNAFTLNDLYCVEWDVKLYYTIPLPKSVDNGKLFQTFIILHST